MCYIQIQVILILCQPYSTLRERCIWETVYTQDVWVFMKDVELNLYPFIFFLVSISRAALVWKQAFEQLRLDEFNNVIIKRIQHMSLIKTVF